jgi:hypothetical protein
MGKQEVPADSGDARENIGNQDDMIEYDTVNKVLPVPLTERERLEIGETVAAAQSKAEHAERDKKAADEEYKGVIDGAYADVSAGLAQLRRGKKDVEVQCTVFLDYRLGHYKLTRNDTFEVLESRPMTRSERQMGMKFPDSKKDKK